MLSTTYTIGQDIEILLVEDSPHEAELTVRSLRKNNLVNKLLHLHDGEEALDFILCLNKYTSRNVLKIPRLILLDLKLPKVDGLEVLKALKEDTHLNPIPVIVLSSSMEEQDILASYKAGASSYIVKPVDFESFSKAIVQVGRYWLGLNVPPIQKIPSR